MTVLVLLLLQVAVSAEPCALHASVWVLSFEFAPLVDELSACDVLDEPDDSDVTSPIVLVGLELEELVPPVLVVVPPFEVEVGFAVELDVAESDAPFPSLVLEFVFVALSSPWVWLPCVWSPWV